MKKLLIAVFAAFTIIVFAACASYSGAPAPPDISTPAILSDNSGTISPVAEIAEPLQATTAVSPAENGSSTDTGVTLEVSHITAQTTAPDIAGNESIVTFILTNNTSRDVSYSSGHSIALMIDGKTTPFGSGAVGLPGILPPGGQSEISVRTFGPGEYRATKSVIAYSEEYQLHAYFTIDDDSIPPDTDNFVMELLLADPSGAVLELTNGFRYGNVYFDRQYRLLRNTGGKWAAVPGINTRFFPDDMHHVAPRQSRQFIKNWGWLYGELEPGEYRIEKSFRHYAGETTQYNLYIQFTIAGRPQAHPYIFGQNPFADQTTFRAKVIENPYYSYAYRWHPEELLVYRIPSIWDDELTTAGSAGERSFIQPNHYASVLNICGTPMLFSDVPLGAVVDITFSGIVLQSDPAIIPGTILVQIVG